MVVARTPQAAMPKANMASIEVLTQDMRVSVKIFLIIPTERALSLEGYADYNCRATVGHDAKQGAIA